MWGSSKTPDAQFAEAIERMHNIFRDCDGEFRILSKAANTDGRDSDAFKAAAAYLQKCQRRRMEEFHLMETECGPAQESYKQCTMRPENAGASHRCLPVLHAYLDCAERALHKNGKAHGKK